MPGPSLRAVGPDERPPASSRARAKSITAAARDGVPREVLVALRARVAKAVQDPETPARDLAALSKRLMDIVREIEAIDAKESVRVRQERAGGDDYGTFDPAAV